MVHDPLFIVVAIACLAVVAVLLVGVGGFARGGAFNAKYANKIMRLRILAQFVAVVPWRLRFQVMTYFMAKCLHPLTGVGSRTLDLRRGLRKRPA